jgi:hypothetical protein
MIICVCRNISTNNYKTEDELRERIMQADFACGLCQTKYLLDEQSDSDEKDIAV